MSWSRAYRSWDQSWELNHLSNSSLFCDFYHCHQINPFRSASLFAYCPLPYVVATLSMLLPPCLHHCIHHLCSIVETCPSCHLVFVGTWFFSPPYVCWKSVPQWLQAIEGFLQPPVEVMAIACQWNEGISYNSTWKLLPYSRPLWCSGKMHGKLDAASLALCW